MAMQRAASISSCETYRYMLPFIMLNPSVADAEIDDPTIRRCIGFARREGADGIFPAALKSANDPFGPANAEALANVASEADATRMPIICAWGANVPNGGDRAAIEQLKRDGARLACLGKTKSGAPRHPLYVRADQPFMEFP